jgi:hypothetical protein
MFSISNRISYSDSMVLSKPPLNTASWRGVIPEYGPGGHPSAWFDTPYEPLGGTHWVETQGRLVLNMLLRMTEQHALAENLRDSEGHQLEAHFLTGSGMPEAFIVTPFRSVRDGMANLITDHAEDFGALNPKISREAVLSWAGFDERGRRNTRTEGRIGTLHAFQGKESPTVFLLLGGSTKSPRAVEWAGGIPNLLNVAVTRAKEAFYVIGGHRLWTRCPSFHSATS